MSTIQSPADFRSGDPFAARRRRRHQWRQNFPSKGSSAEPSGTIKHLDPASGLSAESCYEAERRLLFPDFQQLREKLAKLAEFLLNKVHDGDSPGKEFGMEGRLRPSFAAAVKEITEESTASAGPWTPTAPNELSRRPPPGPPDWM